MFDITQIKIKVFIWDYYFYIKKIDFNHNLSFSKIEQFYNCTKSQISNLISFYLIKKIDTLF